MNGQQGQAGNLRDTLRDSRSEPNIDGSAPELGMMSREYRIQIRVFSLFRAIAEAPNGRTPFAPYSQPKTERRILRRGRPARCAWIWADTLVRPYTPGVVPSIIYVPRLRPGNEEIFPAPLLFQEPGAFIQS